MESCLDAWSHFSLAACVCEHVPLEAADLYLLSSVVGVGFSSEDRLLLWPLSLISGF